MIYISIQWENFQDRFQNFRNTMSVTADGNRIFTHRFNREVTVCDNKTIAVSHFT